MFGPILEQTWGPKRFLFYYILCGIGAGLIQEGVQYIQYITELSQHTEVNLIGYGIISMDQYLNMMTTVGASGAVYAILLAFGMLYPNNQLFIFPLPFPIKAKFFVIGYAAIELWAGLANSAGDNVAHFAHLGGMLFGLILILYWRKKVKTMGHIITDLKETFRRGNIFIQLIYINVSIFYHWHVNQCFLATISAQYTRYIRHIRFTGFLYSVLSSTMVDYHLYVHARRSSAYPIQYALVVLVRKLVSTLFSAKHLRGLYILGGILGGLLYMVAYNVFPLFNQEVAVSTLVGASASVLAIVAATAYREPNYRVQLFLFGAIRLKYLALVVIGIDILSITSSNAGGHIAHLGGALAGLWFAASLSKGADLTAWINWLLDAFISLFQKKTWKHKPKMKVHYGGGTTSREKRL